MPKNGYIIFPGSSSTQLAKKLSRSLNWTLGKTEIARFTNSELRLRVSTKVKNKNCLVVQSTSTPVNDNLFYLFLQVETLKRSGAKQIVAVIPYFGYSRQHKTFRPGECASTDMILKILAVLGVSEVITIDFHNLDALGSTPIPVKSISALPILAETVARQIDISKAVMVSPDEGGIRRAQNFANCLFDQKNKQIIFIKKQRDYDKIHKINHQELIGRLKIAGKTVIIVDDICTTGKTLLSAVKFCMWQGAEKIYAVITHPDMDEITLGMIEKSQIVKLFTTNTIEYFKTYVTSSKKVEIVDIANVIAPTIFINP